MGQELSPLKMKKSGARLFLTQERFEINITGKSNFAYCIESIKNFAKLVINKD